MSFDTERAGGCHLILGGGGFIGRHVALLLARSGHRVTIVQRGPATCRFPPDVANRIAWLRADVATADWGALLAGVAVVHHLAWSTIPASAIADPSADLTSNVAATVRLLEAVRRCPSPPRVVFASSGGTVYGRPLRIPLAETEPLAPITPYGAAKAAVEMYLGSYRALYGLDCRVARLSNPFGAGQDVRRGQGAVTVFLQLALHGQPITIWGDGETIRDYIHVSDAASGLVALACAPPIQAPWTFNLASGHGLSLNGIVAEMERQLDRRIAVTRTSPRPFDVPVNVLDVTLARSVLGWSPRVPFADAIARTVDDLRRNVLLSTADTGAQPLAHPGAGPSRAAAFATGPVVNLVNMAARR